MDLDLDKITYENSWKKVLIVDTRMPTCIHTYTHSTLHTHLCVVYCVCVCSGLKCLLRGSHDLLQEERGDGRERECGEGGKT